MLSNLSKTKRSQDHHLVCSFLYGGIKSAKGLTLLVRSVETKRQTK